MTTHHREVLDRTGYRLTVDDDFDGPELDPAVWLPYYLPQWSSRAASAARYELVDSELRLRIDADQKPWCPEWNGPVRVSSLQTGVFSGPASSGIGQHRFEAGLVVREPQPEQRLLTPRYGLFEVALRAPTDPATMLALWMIGFEDRPERSGEICVAEIFGRDVGADAARVGMGVHPFADPDLRDEFEQVHLRIDPRASHVYAAEWTSTSIGFYVDDRLVKVVGQSPGYPMQVMLGFYELDRAPGPAAAADYPKVATIDWFRAWQRPGDSP